MKYNTALLIMIMLAAGPAAAQPLQLPAKVTEARRTERQRLEKMVRENLALPLADSTALAWESAFWAMELMRYNPPFAKEKIEEGFAKFSSLDGEFQRAFVEWIYTNYPKAYAAPLRRVFDTAGNHKLKAMCGEYLLAANVINRELARTLMREVGLEVKDRGKPSPWLIQLTHSMYNCANPDFVRQQEKNSPVYLLLQPGFLPGHTVVFSFQRRNRNFPGLTLVRDTAGRFIRNEQHAYFSVPQLARSITNMPGYLTNGNTPAGIMRMDGVGVSNNSYIGPTENLQLSLPGELGYAHFFKDGTIPEMDTGAGIFTARNGMLLRYKALLPGNWQENREMERAFYAGWCGRTEIISHGTTINPDYYKGTVYYPQTPTLGCLCTRERWDAATGKRLYSDQQKLVDAVKKAGGADGYFVVIELDDQQRPVTLKELLPFLKKAGGQ